MLLRIDHRRKRKFSTNDSIRALNPSWVELTLRGDVARLLTLTDVALCSACEGRDRYGRLTTDTARRCGGKRRESKHT